MASRNEWRQVGGNQFEDEAEGTAGRQVWISDGVLGYARALAEGETLAEAVADFESAGEPADDIRVYQGGVLVDLMDLAE